MNVKPIPMPLLCDSLTLIVPTKTGTVETPIANVRVECSESIEGGASNNPKSAAEITVWVDFHHSTPAEYPLGAWVRYCGETFEITARKIYRADEPHHLKLTAKRINWNGGEPA